MREAPPRRNDEVLFDAWCSGDVRAGNELVARHDRGLRIYLARRVGRHADDTVQNVWAAMTRCRTGFERRCAFRTYLYSFARNFANEARRRHERDRRIDALDGDIIRDPGPGAAQLLEHAEDAARLNDALAILPAELENMVRHYYLDGRTATELAGSLGIPENTARSRLRRARALLQRALRGADPIPRPLGRVSAAAHSGGSVR